jgi:hypothetical protein
LAVIASLAVLLPAVFLVATQGLFVVAVIAFGPESAPGIAPAAALAGTVECGLLWHRLARFARRDRVIVKK